MDRLVRAQIDLENFDYNFGQIRGLLRPETKILAVVKANAYGHGAIEIAKRAQKLGAVYLGVACLYEARILREAGLKLPILVLGYTDPESFSQALRLDLTLNIMDEVDLIFLDKAARKARKRVRVHLKVDTGMHRIGIMPEKVANFLKTSEDCSNIILEGIFSHFAAADEKDLRFTYQQLDVFKKVLAQIGGKIPMAHIANSAANLRLPSAQFSMVRLGKILYGLAPSLDFRLPFIPRPLLSLKTQIVQIRKIKKGESVGYGRKFMAEKETLVGAIPVGYADGFRRAPNNWGEVLVCGKKAPLLGLVSMDQSSIDITKIPNVKVGDEVVLVGKQGKEVISMWDVAKKLGTSAYEVTSAIAPRVERVYNNL